MLLIAVHPNNKKQPGLALWDPGLTIGWAEPRSTRTQQCWSSASRFCLLHDKVWHRKGWKHGSADSREGARETLGLGCSPEQLESS